MESKNKNNFQFQADILRGAVCIGLVASVIGLIFNQFYSHGIPMDYTKMRQPLTESEKQLKEKPDDIEKSNNEKDPVDSKKTKCEPYYIFFEEAYTEYFEPGIAIFIDTRLEEDFKKGHIKGAINLPNDQTRPAFKKYKNKLPIDGFYIFYCDEACDSSMETAYFFCRNGYQDMHIFVAEEAYTVWEEMGYPVE